MAISSDTLSILTKQYIEALHCLLDASEFSDAELDPARTKLEEFEAEILKLIPPTD